MVDDSSAPFRTRNVSTPKGVTKNEPDYPAKRFSSEFALTVSELELVWTCPPRLNRRPLRCSEEAMCLWTTNLNLIVEATAPYRPGSVSTRKG